MNTRIPFASVLGLAGGRTPIFVGLGLAVLATVFLPAQAAADMTLNVYAPVRSRVFIDGRYRGCTPVSGQVLAPGRHELEVENTVTRQFVVFDIDVDSTGERVRRYDIDFDGRSRVEETVVTRRSLVVEPSVSGRRPQAAAAAPRPSSSVRRVRYYEPYYDRTATAGRSKVEVVTVHRPSRDKVRRRNAIIAAGVANEMFNSGRRRKDIRKGAVAATVLNEILTR